MDCSEPTMVPALEGSPSTTQIDQNPGSDCEQPANSQLINKSADMIDDGNEGLVNSEAVGEPRTPCGPHHHNHDHHAVSSGHLHDTEGSSRVHGSQAFFTEEEQAEERQHFQTVLSAFRCYRTHGVRKIVRQRQYFQALQKSQRDKLPNLMEHLNALRQCVEINHKFLERMLSQTPFDDAFVMPDDNQQEPQSTEPIGTFHMDKVHTTLRMFVRDWSKDGLLERKQAYDPLIDAVERYFPPDKCDVSQVQVLNPGAGLGRLSWELAKRGYTSIGNEFSLYMLLASNFVLNCCREVDGFKIYPWIGHASNNLSSANQMLGVSIPDVNPADELPVGHNFGMVAGDFLEVFERNCTWDCLVTCFFIDTARNIIEYVEHIWSLLKPGGLWINLGPLLYHFSDMPRESCLELTYQHLRIVIINTGFEFLEEKTDVPCSYVQNPMSMLRYEYRCIYFVCRKPVMKTHSPPMPEISPVPLENLEG